MVTLTALPPDAVFTDSEETPDFAATEPPKRRGRPPKNGGTAPPRIPKTTTTRTATRWPNKADVEQNLLTLVEGVSALVSVADTLDGEVIATGGPNIVHELIVLAETDKRLRRYLEITAAPGRYGPLIIATMGVAFPIMIHHNLLRLPAQFRTPEQETEGL